MILRPAPALPPAFSLHSLHFFFFLLAFTLLSFTSQRVFAAAPDKEKVVLEKLLASLQFQQGNIDLPGNIATLKLPAGFRYLPPAETERLLVEGWGNPPGSNTLGMIVPASNPLSKDGWGVIITYEDTGHVTDSNANKIDYDKLLSEIQTDLQETNMQRKRLGFPQSSVVDWAEPPQYDRATNRFYWAKEVRFGTSTGNMLNYNLRILGRKGVLVLNAVAEMTQLKQVKAEMKQIAEFTSFTPGNTYADFNIKTDKIADFGLATLIVGNVTNKTGMVEKLLAVVLLFKHFIILGLLAIGAFFMRFSKMGKMGKTGKTAPA